LRKIINKTLPDDTPALRALLGKLREEPAVDIHGLGAPARPFLSALVFKRLQKPLAIICPTAGEAAAFARDLTLFVDEDDILHYPPLDFFSIDMFALQRAEELARLRALTILQVDSHKIFVTSIEACAQKVMPFDRFQKQLEIISKGDILQLEEFTQKLMDGGYRRVSLVESHGEFSLRGNILDIFPPTMTEPLRLEMSGDEVETIRRFDCASQRSGASVNAFVFGPAAEIIMDEAGLLRAVRNVKRRADELELPRDMRRRLTETLREQTAAVVNPIFLPLFYEDYDRPESFGDQSLSSVFDYLPQHTLIAQNDPLAIEQAARNAASGIDKILYKARAGGRFYLESSGIYLSEETLRGHLARYRRIRFISLSIDTPGQPAASVRILAEPAAVVPEIRQGEVREEALLRAAALQMKEWLARGLGVFFVSPTPEDRARMAHLLAGYDLQLEEQAGGLLPATGHDPEKKRTVFVCEGKMSGGFVSGDLGVAFLSEEEIFSRKKARRPSRPRREGYFLKSFGELKEGDYVVHTDFGIGIYRGLQKITVGKIENDFLVIEYLGTDRLYLPVNSLERIQRYLGPEGYTPRVDKMGGTSWDSVKERVKKSIRDVAEELVAIYAAREAMERKSFAPPENLYEEFSSAFPFEETPDQARAIEDVHADMDDAKPMDRLICGDAGFGKTEVALRAAFRAVMDGRQVALLAPTTILTEQHYATFSGRLADYPIRVEVLNRFKSAAQIKTTLTDLRLGRVDIVIGTHRLLQKDVSFKDLGLVIIDEEQRFGVAHKEKLKKMRTLVDVLTLSATPIPRTLHLSLVGIRDLSIINTPPVERQPIRTYVLEFDEEVITTAIRAELARGGQVFFLHDRVRSIYSIAHLVQRLVPQARTGVVHGQMKPAEIEKTMSLFIRHELDVLVCTTIIGSGLDIPSANTIIINRADRFGLSQLYQIRGRVGRGSLEASAYLLLPRGALLSRDALKRLQAIKEFSEPGSGFRIAYNDLEIRGGGNLLGLSQAGHISAVGYELYTEMMEKTVREIKGEMPPVENEFPEISLGISAFLPEDYIQDIHQRLILYKRISLAADMEEIGELEKELTDCYGPLPPRTANLLRVINLRNELKPLRATKMGFDGRYFYVYFRQSSPIDPSHIVSLSAKKIKGLRFTPDYKLFLPAKPASDGEILTQAEELLKMLAP